MTDCNTISLTIELPEATYKRLQTFAAIRNSPFDNVVSAVLTDGMNAIENKFPAMGEKARVRRVREDLCPAKAKWPF
jgi:hypothetical protein